MIDRVESTRVISFLDGLRAEPLPRPGERHMAIPPDRFLRAIPRTEWHIGYDVVHLKGPIPIISLNVQEVRVWFLGRQSDIEKLLMGRDVQFLRVAFEVA